MSEHSPGKRVLYHIVGFYFSENIWSNTPISDSLLGASVIESSWNIQRTIADETMLKRWQIRQSTVGYVQKFSADKDEMSRHELDRASLLSSLRVALDELNASPDADRHYQGIWQLRDALEYWIDRLEADARTDVAKYGIDSGPEHGLAPIVPVK